MTNNNAAGKVWLVGAGPGDRGLFTLKGLEVLQQADVVVYDALVGDGVLSMIPDGAKLIDVGKRAGDHKMPQEEMNKVLLTEAQAGHKVVRLKGGDPFLFGRGGEELELLVEHGVPFEIIPGVTSAIAVPAYNGIPVTHRDFTSSIHIITGHKRSAKIQQEASGGDIGDAQRKAGDPDYDIDFEALVRTKGTLVFLMGFAALPDIVAGLLKAGMDPDMSAAVLQQGTTSKQNRAVGTISTIEEESKRKQIHTPAIILVGKVCTLADQFFWYEKLPLFGKRILLTRPRENASKTAALLREKGAEVLELPSIKTESISPNKELADALKIKFQWLVFTSPIGVRVFFEEFLREHDIRALFGVKIAVIGEGTKKELKQRGLQADFVPSVYDGETLGKELSQELKEGDTVLIPRARIGGKELTDALAGVKGVKILDIPTYETLFEASEAINEKAEIEQGLIDYAVFTSASTVEGFAKTVGDVDYSALKAICIGKQTKAAADRLGMQTVMAEKATIEALVNKVIEVASENNASAN